MLLPAKTILYSGTNLANVNSVIIKAYSEKQPLFVWNGHSRILDCPLEFFFIYSNHLTGSLGIPTESSVNYKMP